MSLIAIYIYIYQIGLHITLEISSHTSRCKVIDDGININLIQ
jgi:hypothetical protein